MKIIIEVDAQNGLSVSGYIRPSAWQALRDVITVLTMLAQLMEALHRMGWI